MTLSGGFFDVASKEMRIAELETLSQQADLWNNADEAARVMKERSEAQAIVDLFNSLERSHADATAALELACETKDEDFLKEAFKLADALAAQLERHEFLRKMRGEFDRSHAILEVNAGSGGTEAQDWAEMLLRMYLRWAERKGFQIEELDYQPGEGAGIKRAAISVQGDYAYGYLRSETGVHRLVRISPFDSNARRHTSFASIMVTPELTDDVEVAIDEKDLKTDTYRSSGAGGQHVNKTDSAVRITHIPTGIVVACQNERSQHKNRARAMQILRAKLFELKQREKSDKLKAIQGERKSIDFGSQIRSYVMQPYQMVKDLRTDYETSGVDAVLNGDIDPFIESFLMSEDTNG